MVWDLKVWHIPIFYIAVVLTFILPKIPVVGKFFRVINTALHEFGHALMTLILAGKVERIDLFKDTSGLTTYRSKNKISVFLVALAGYPFATLGAHIGFYLLSVDAAQAFVLGLTILFIVMLLFWVRNAYGMIWIVLFCILNLFLLFYGNKTYIDVAALFYATSILADSISAAVDLIIRSIKMPKQSGDATDLAKITHIPALIWSLVFGVYTGWVTYWVIKMIFF